MANALNVCLSCGKKLTSFELDKMCATLIQQEEMQDFSPLCFSCSILVMRNFNGLFTEEILQ